MPSLEDLVRDAVAEQQASVPALDRIGVRAEAFRRKRRRSATIASLTFALAVGLIGAALVHEHSAAPVAAQRTVPTTTAPRPPSIVPLDGAVAPRLGDRFDQLAGPPMTLDSLRGRWIVLNFFATWAVPAVNVNTALNEFVHATGASAPATVVTVVYRETVDPVRAFAADKEFPGPVLLDPDSSLAASYNVKGVPETLLIDPAGRLRYEVVGPLDVTTLEQLLVSGS